MAGPVIFSHAIVALEPYVPLTGSWSNVGQQVQVFTARAHDIVPN